MVINLPNEVDLKSPVNVLMIWCSSTLLEIGFATPSKSVTLENICFPNEAWRRMFYPCICTILSLCFVYFRIMFLLSKVKADTRLCFLSWHLPFSGMIISDVIEPSVVYSQVGFAWCNTVA